jgi:hypothetical protein
MDKSTSSDDIGTVLGKAPCPNCGIQVTAGYARCPKCKAEMPKSAATNRTPASGGGTSATGRTISLGAVLIAVLITALASYLAHKEWPRVVGERIQAAAPADKSNDAGPDEIPEDTEVNRDELLDELTKSLAEAKVWSWVDVDENDKYTVVVRSQFCDESLLGEAIDAVTENLATGFTKVRCYARYGELVFAEPLTPASK